VSVSERWNGWFQNRAVWIDAVSIEKAL